MPEFSSQTKVVEVVEAGNERDGGKGANPQWGPSEYLFRLSVFHYGV